jgi:hypothetical protein
MRDWTYTELKAKVTADLDLENEAALSATEWLGLFNEAIDEAEAEIHKLGCEDEYFLDSAFLTIVSGTAEYALPTTIYANKIRGIIYQNSNDIYPIKRVRGINRFSQVAELNVNASAAETLQYLLTNAASTGRRIVFTPTPQFSSSSIVKVWFIRNAKQLAAGADILDIPEFANFVMSYVRFKIMKKDGDARVEIEAQELQAQRQLMIDTLTEMVPDEDNEIIPDLSHYEEHL